MVAKNKKKTHIYRTCCQTIVKNVQRVCNEEKLANARMFSLTRASDRARNYCGLSSSTMHNLLTNDFVLAEGEMDIRDSRRKITEEDEALIRPSLVNLILAKVNPTLNSLLSQIKIDNPTWEWGRTTLYEALKRIGFKFNNKAYGYYDKLREDEDNVALRVKYIANYFKYIDEGRYMVYMDESWINKNARPGKVWHDGTSETVFDVPHGKGARWILIGAGGKNGWVENSFRMWKGNVKSEDYHHEMNTEIFEDWNLKYLLPNIPPNSVIVMDRASYHCALTDDSKPAVNVWTKQQLIDWLISRGIKDEQGVVYTNEVLLGFSKAYIWSICHTNRPAKKFKIFDIINEYNRNNNTDIKINMLPVAHPVLNPIELLWNWIKTHVRNNNTTFSMVDIETLTRARVQELDSTWWIKACDHSHKFAENYQVADNIVFNGELIANVGEMEEEIVD